MHGPRGKGKNALMTFNLKGVWSKRGDRRTEPHPAQWTGQKKAPLPEDVGRTENPHRANFGRRARIEERRTIKTGKIRVVKKWKRQVRGRHRTTFCEKTRKFTSEKELCPENVFKRENRATGASPRWEEIPARRVETSVAEARAGRLIRTRIESTREKKRQQAGLVKGREPRYKLEEVAGRARGREWETYKWARRHSTLKKRSAKNGEGAGWRVRGAKRKEGFGVV